MHRRGRPVGRRSGPRCPVAAVRLHFCSDEGRHGHAAVLDLRLPVPRDRLLVVEAVERARRAGDVQGVPEADRGVEALGERLEVRLRLRQPRLGGRGRRADEGGRGGEDRQATATSSFSACVGRCRACRGARALAGVVCVACSAAARRAMARVHELAASRAGFLCVEQRASPDSASVVVRSAAA